MTTVETPRLVLRPLQASDAEPFMEIHQDPEVIKYVLQGRSAGRAHGGVAEHRDDDWPLASPRLCVRGAVERDREVDRRARSDAPTCLQSRRRGPASRPITFASTSRSHWINGGHDDGTRRLRYLEWTWDPDPADSSYTVDYAYLLRDADGTLRVERDRHIEGLFARGDWLRLMRTPGFSRGSCRSSTRSWSRASTKSSSGQSRGDHVDARVSHARSVCGGWIAGLHGGTARAAGARPGRRTPHRPPRSLAPVAVEAQPLAANVQRRGRSAGLSRGAVAGRSARRSDEGRSGPRCEAPAGTARSPCAAHRAHQPGGAGQGRARIGAGGAAAGRLHAGDREDRQRERRHAAAPHRQPAGRPGLRGHVEALRRADAAAAPAREREHRAAHRSLSRSGDVHRPADDGEPQRARSRVRGRADLFERVRAAARPRSRSTSARGRRTSGFAPRCPSCSP